MSKIKRMLGSRAVLALGAWVAYVLMFIPLYRLVGQVVAALAILPAVVTGWLFGMRVGLLTGLLTFPLNMLLTALVTGAAWEMMASEGLFGSVLILLIGAVVGRLHDLGEQVRWELAERKRAEEALRKAHDGLEIRVEERTAELAQANRELEAEITERKRAEEALAHERDMLHVLMESVPDWIFFKDAESRIVRSNRAHAQLLGFDDPQEIIGKTDFDLFPSEDAQRFYDEEQRMLQSGQSVVARLGQTPSKDGEVLWVSETKIPLKDETGRVIGLVGISRDVTEIKRAEEALEKAYAEVEKQVEERTAELRQEIVEREQAEEALAYERDLLQALMDNSPDYIFFKDRGSRFVRTNKAHAQLLLGLSDPQEAIGKTDFDLFPEKHDDAQRFYDEEQMIMETRQTVIAREWQVPSITTGEIIWLSEHKVPLTDRTGQVVGFLGLGRDITERKRAEKALAQEQYLLNTLMDNIPDTIYFKDTASRFTRINRAQAQVLGVDPDEAIGKTDFDFFTPEHARDAYVDEQEIVKSGQPLIGKVERIRRADRQNLWVSATKVPITDKEGRVTGIVGVSRDITERKRAEETIRQLAYHDTLTGLPNRRLFNDRLNLALAHAHRNQQKLAVMLLDLDHFKDVNDTLGHGVGDQLLQVVSEQLTNLLRKGDTVARMGGDEFMLLLPEVAGGEGAAEAASASVVAQKILEAIREPFVLNGHELHVTTSIGIAMYPDDGGDADMLMKNADIAMYRAKDQGRDNYQCWQPITQEQ